MKLPTKLKKRAKIGKEYILIDNGTAAFKTSLFDIIGDADTSNVEPFFPKNEGDVEVYHKFVDIKDRLGLSCADKGWLLIDKDLKPIVENPKIKLTTFKDLYNDIWHTTLILSKDNEIVGIVMGMLFSQDTKEIGKAFDELNENYNVFKSLNEKLEKILEDYGFCTRIKELLNQDGFEKYDTFYNEKEQNFGVNLQNGKKIIFQWDSNGKYDFIDEKGNPIIWWGTGNSFIYEYSPIKLRDHLFTIAKNQGQIKLKNDEE